jgi:hypothetical protein
MRNLFELGNNERERILEMHINATKKLYLMEQEQIPTIEQIEGKLNEMLTVDEERKKLLKYGNVNTIKLETALMNSMVQGTDKPAFGRLIRRIKSGPSTESPTELINYYSNTANNLVDDFKNTWNLPEAEGKELKVFFTEKKINVNSGGGTNETEKIKFEVNWEPESNVQLYDNNEWKVSDEFKRLFTSGVTTPIQRLRKEYPKINISLLELSIETSASRYRNTGGASEFTFSQLSGFRNNSAKNHIIGDLVANYVLNTKEVTPTQKYLGSNGDGTTGPNPPEPNRYIDGGEVKMESQPTQPRNQFGEPHTTPEEYNKYKYLKVKIVLVADFGENYPKESRNDVFEYDYSIEYGERQKTTTKKIKTPTKFPPFKLIKDISTIFRISPEKCAAYN